MITALRVDGRQSSKRNNRGKETEQAKPGDQDASKNAGGAQARDKVDDRMKAVEREMAEVKGLVKAHKGEQAVVCRLDPRIEDLLAGHLV